MRFMTLDELSVGHSGVITAVGGEGDPSVPAA